MTGSEPSAPREPLFDTVRQVYLAGGTGRLDVPGAGAGGRLYFVGGDLYLAPDHPLCGRAEILIGSAAGGKKAAGGAGPGAGAGVGTGQRAVGGPDALERLTRDLCRLLGDWEAAGSSFTEGPAEIRVDLIGPLPTARLLATGAVQDRAEFELLRRLGGEDQRYQAVPRADGAPPPALLDSHEAFFLSRLERPAAVRELLRQADLDRPTALEKLCRLLAVDLIRRAEQMPAGEASTWLAPRLVEKLAQRVGEGLESQPLELAPEDHRRQLADLLGRLGQISHFELLGVGLGSTTDELHAAYTRLARLVHPSHAERLRLKPGEAGLRMLFERATEAYLTLSDPERSRRYFESLDGEVPGGPPQEESGRRQEEERVAREAYQVARSMVTRQEFHSAIQLLEQAVRAAPRPEYYALLAECQAENRNWLDRALVNLSKAVQLKPRDAELRLRLGELYERSGNLARAREEYQAALERMPAHPEALEGLERLASAPAAAGGFLGRLLARFRSPGETG